MGACPQRRASQSVLSRRDQDKQRSLGATGLPAQATTQTQSHGDVVAHTDE
jgi:hypothetical protein